MIEHEDAGCLHVYRANRPSLLGADFRFFADRSVFSFRTPRLKRKNTSGCERLALFLEVENTYLSMFLVLGGLGLILGSFGMGVGVMKNLADRKNEIAVLRQE